MIYIHKETFEIKHDIDESDYGHVIGIEDDIIAPSIQVLNRKGYTTTQCCSGHPWSVNPKYFPEYLPDSYILHAGMGYIEFAEGISLPELPPEFIITPTSNDGCFLIYAFCHKRKSRYTIDDVNELMEQLYEWALNLPDFKDVEPEKLLKPSEEIVRNDSRLPVFHVIIRPSKKIGGYWADAFSLPCRVSTFAHGNTVREVQRAIYDKITNWIDNECPEKYEFFEDYEIEDYLITFEVKDQDLE